MDKQAENFNSSGQNDFEELNNNLTRLVDVYLTVIHSISPNQNYKTEDSIPEHIREIMRMMLSILSKCVDLCEQSKDLKPIYFEIKYLKSLLYLLRVVKDEFKEMQNKLKRRKEIAKDRLSKPKKLLEELKELGKFENLAYEVLEQEQKDRIYSIYKNYLSISYNVNLPKTKVGTNDDAKSIANKQLEMTASNGIVKKKIIIDSTENGQDVQICEKKIDENDEKNFKESISEQLELIEDKQKQIEQLLSDEVNNDELSVTINIGKLYRDYENRIIEVRKTIMIFYVQKNYSDQNEKEQRRMRAALAAYIYNTEQTYALRTNIDFYIKLDDNKKKYEKMEMEEDNVKIMEQYVNAFDKKINTIQIFSKIILDKIGVLIQVVEGKNSKTGNICQNKEKEMEQRNQIQNENENKDINNKIKKINNKSDEEKIKFINDNGRTQGENNLNNKKVYNNYKADNLNKNGLDNKKGMEKVNNDEKIEQGDKIKTNAPNNNDIFNQSNSNNNDTQNKKYEVNNPFENELKDKKEIEETDANNNIYNKNKSNNDGKIDDNRSEDLYENERAILGPEQKENQGLDNEIQPIIKDGNDNKMRNWGIGIFVLGGTGTILVLVVPSVKIVFIAVPLLFALIGIILLGIHLCRKNNQPPIDIATANDNNNLNNSISIDNLKNNLKDNLIEYEDTKLSVPGNENHI